MPSRVAEPLAPGTRLTPAGSGEDWIVGTGKPEAVTMLNTGNPTLAFTTLRALRMGTLATVRARCWAAEAAAAEALRATECTPSWWATTTPEMVAVQVAR